MLAQAACLAGMLGTLACAVQAQAPAAPRQDTGEPTRLPQVFVSAPSPDHSLRRTPHGVSVITAGEIERSGARSIAELLGRQANLNLQSYFGSDKNAGIDLRGMGATAGSNVLVLLDGVRLNEIDLSGADLSTVALEQIERIEIVRGGGAVRYGDGAVAGVINIITRRAQPGAGSSPALDATLARGSYAMRDAQVQLRTSTRTLGLDLQLGESDQAGYRRNGGLYRRNATGELRLVPAGLDFLEAWVRVASHQDRYGLPGPVSAADFAAGSAARRASNTPTDNGNTDDTVTTVGLFADFEHAGRWELQASYRDRVNDYLLGYSPLAPLPDQLSTIRSQRHEWQLRYELDLQAWGQTHTVVAGLQSQTGDYARRMNGRAVPEQSQQKLGAIESLGHYLSTNVRASPTLALNAGVRINRFTSTLRDERYTRDCVFNPFPIRVCTPYAFALQNTNGGNWHNRAAELGASWDATAALTVFGSVSRHFRNPNLDELAAAAADLRPQSGRTIELGARWNPMPSLELSGTLFEMRNRDEIYYGADPASGLSENRNYDRPTRRTGAEVEARWQATPRLEILARIGHIVPRFVGTDADIPLVPRTTISLSAQWRLEHQARWSLALRHVGVRFDGNDFDNRTWPRLPAYTVVDAAWQQEIGNATWSVGIDNLFNRAYSTLGYSATYYPMPERSLVARLRLRW